jgi:phosphoribosylaminoimidazolecarboxamide formyltransferase/IMP cyclohydrolase
MKKNKNALVSVFDKSNLDLISKFLIKKKYTIYSTGGSSKYLKKINVPHVEISKYTKQKEILSGRVKTLHPKIFGGILATSSRSHQAELKKEKIINFDLIIVNLYPFEKTINNTKKTDEIIEMIDIGGHSLIRAASKNYLKSTILVDPSDYRNFIKSFPETVSAKKKYAIKAMKHITKYDISITKWFEGIEDKEYSLRYGENPQQKATAFINNDMFKQLSGEKKLSYNNLLDLDAALTIAYATNSDKHICTIVKHNIPCGASIETSQIKSYTNALDGDPVSAFGGVVAFNKKVTSLTAKNLLKNFYEVVAAPNFDEEALKILKKRVNLRVLKVKKYKAKIEQRSIFAGMLVQQANNKKSTIKKVYGVNKLNDEKINFFSNVLKAVKSNAIAIFDQTSLVSQSGGQTSRIDSLENCLYKFNLKQKKKRNNKLFLFSDAFFPFTDSLKLIKKKKLKIDIYAPMGSKNDSIIEEFVKKHKLNFFKLSDRHFKH